jgi:hypothetical protein
MPRASLEDVGQIQLTHVISCEHAEILNLTCFVRVALRVQFFF